MDYSEALALLEEPSQVKAALPLAYVLEQAGVQIMSSEGKLHAVCPFHDDHDPSLDVYAWGDGERFGCFACGAGGDVFDLIQCFWPMGFRASVEAAKRAITKMQSEGWTAPVLSAAPPWDEDAAKSLLVKARGAGIETVDQLINNKQWQFNGEWLAARWGVAGLGDEILVPYWDTSARLAAIKHRPSSGSRPLISLPGSQLKGTLYGEWRGLLPRDKADVIILCEGESDTWTLDWQVGTYYNVFGLPTGAGALPFGHEFFMNQRRVWLAFDGDEAGRLAAGHWEPLLTDWGNIVSILPIPNGHDVTSYEGTSALLSALEVQ